MLVEHPMNDRYTRVTAPAGFDGQGTRRDYYFKTRNAAREFRLRIKRWKAEQKSPADTLSFDDSDKRWLAYLRAHVGNLELLPAIVTHWDGPLNQLPAAQSRGALQGFCSLPAKQRTRQGDTLRGPLHLQTSAKTSGWLHGPRTGNCRDPFLSRYRKNF